MAPDGSAAKRLLASGYPILTAALATGFSSDQSHLHRHFQRRLGITPGQYAKGCQLH
ncbi:MAG: helix-turn-helix domain-containing protein [Cyanobacteria bacterium P01_H01_bin.105]